MGFGFRRHGAYKKVSSGTLTPAQGTLSLERTALTLNSEIDGLAASGSVVITNSGGGNLAGVQKGTITYTSGSGWLSASISNSVLTVTANPASVGGVGGTYLGHVPVTDANASNSPQTVDVTFVVAAAAQPPVIALSVGTLAFAVEAGAGTSSSTLTVNNVGGDPFTDLAVGSTTYGSGSGWLSKSLTGLTITVTVDPAALSVGNYTATFPVTDSNASNTGIVVTVNCAVSPTNPSVLVLTPNTRNFNAIQGGSNPSNLTIAITNGGGATLAGPASGAVTYGSGSGWLTTKSVATVVAGSSYTLTIGLTTGALTAGTYTATFPVTDASAGNSPQTVSVTFNVATPVTPGNYSAPQFTLPTWLTYNGATDVLSGEPFASPNTSTYFTGATHSCATLGQLTTALANCVDTDIIEITADIVIGTSTQTLRTRGDSGWVLIRSSGYASLPAAGTRINPTTHAAALKSLSITGQNPAFRPAQGARGYYFQGLNIEKTSGTGLGGSVVALAASTQTAEAHIPSYFEFRHCCIRNLFTSGGSTYSARGIFLSARYTKIRDCYIDGHTQPGADSQAILIGNCQGDIEIHNCFLEGASENIMIGGFSFAAGSVGHPANLWVHQNYFFKRTDWLTGGAYTAYAVRKNFWEQKAGEKVVFEGNYCENHDGSGQQYDVNLAAKPEIAAEQTYYYVRDIHLRYNKFTSSGGPGGASSTSSDNGLFTPTGTQRVQYASNVWVNRRYTGGSIWWLFGVSRNLPNVTVENNVFSAPNGCVFLTPNASNGGALKAPNFIFRNNINYGASNLTVLTDGNGGEGVLNTICGVGQWTCASNVALTAVWDATLKAAPNNNKTSTTLAGFGFADSANGDYSLVTGSTYKNIGTDGADPGPKWTRFNAIQAGVTTGVPTGS